MTPEEVRVSSSSRNASLVPRGTDKAVDFANYFCTYGYLYHQKDMLADKVRMEAYYNAIFRNASVHFKDKVVLDVGTGTGILAIWSAQAGARKVYAVEATAMADFATKVAESNGFSEVITVFKGYVEDIELPEKVDVIVSEWMGYFLLRESMLDSVLFARDKWLKPSGVLYPSHARMWWAPVSSSLADQKQCELSNSLRDWESFQMNLSERFGVTMESLGPAYEKEQRKYFLQTGHWDSMTPRQVLAPPALLVELDCLTVATTELQSITSDFCLSLHAHSSVDSDCNAWGGWFDVTFKGSATSPSVYPVELSTAPSVHNGTHWGQQIFVIDPPFTTCLSAPHEEAEHNSETKDPLLVTKIVGTFKSDRNKANHRLMDISVDYSLRDNKDNCIQEGSCAYFVE